MVSKSLAFSSVLLVMMLSSCAGTTPTAMQSNGNTNIVDITNVNENSITIIENINVNSQTATTAKKIPLSTKALAPEGCSWEEAIFSKIRFLKHDCPDSSLIFTEKGNLIYRNGEEDYPFIEIFSKLSGETNTQAATRVASKVALIPANCALVTSQSPQRLGADRYEYGLTSVAEKKFIEEHSDESVFMSEDCGTYGKTNGVQYFEFQKENDAFFFIRVGQDTPGVDTETITLGMNN